MAIHDVSKDHPERANPMPNKHDVPEVNLPNTMPFNHSTGAGSLFRQVASGTINVSNNGSVLTTAKVAHGLPYQPAVIAFINNAAPTVVDSDGNLRNLPSNASIPIPNFVTATWSQGGNVITITSYIYAFADPTYVYVNLANSTGSSLNSTVTYYLFAQAST